MKYTLKKYIFKYSFIISLILILITCVINVFLGAESYAYWRNIPFGVACLLLVIYFSRKFIRINSGVFNQRKAFILSFSLLTCSMLIYSFGKVLFFTIYVSAKEEYVKLYDIENNNNFKIVEEIIFDKNSDTFKIELKCIALNDKFFTKQIKNEINNRVKNFSYDRKKIKKDFKFYAEAIDYKLTLKTYFRSLTYYVLLCFILSFFLRSKGLYGINLINFNSKKNQNE